MNIVDLKERIVIASTPVGRLNPVNFTAAEAEFLLNAIDATVQGMSGRADVVEHSRTNYMGRIDAIWAALSLDEGGEGLCAVPLPSTGMTVPLLAADKRRLEWLIPQAKMLAQHFKKPVRLAKFTAREDIEIYQP